MTSIYSERSSTYLYIFHHSRSSNCNNKQVRIIINSKEYRDNYTLTTNTTNTQTNISVIQYRRRYAHLMIRKLSVFETIYDVIALIIVVMIVMLSSKITFQSSNNHNYTILYLYIIYILTNL
jgi:hypothetical protein